METWKNVDWITGKDGVVREYKVRIRNPDIVERPIQLVADLIIGKSTAKDAMKLNSTQTPRRLNQNSVTKGQRSQILIIAHMV